LRGKVPLPSKIVKVLALLSDNPMNG